MVLPLDGCISKSFMCLYKAYSTFLGMTIIFEIFFHEAFLQLYHYYVDFGVGSQMNMFLILKCLNGQKWLLPYF